MSRFWTRECGGCADSSFHTHHLTWYGRWYFSAWNPKWLFHE